jgi:GNAT superfamily N-acetyltransferase
VALQYNLFDYSFKTLEAQDKYEFDCGDADLTEFFLKDAIPHKKELIGVTYFFYDDLRKLAVSFFTVSNDAVRTDTFKENLPEGKRYSFYPAVKIGRFGVNKEFQGQGIGTQMMDYIKWFFVSTNKTGCRFLTVDAYNKPEILDFYGKKNGFTFLSDKDAEKQTRIMKYDLKPYSNGLLMDSYANR